MSRAMLFVAAVAAVALSFPAAGVTRAGASNSVEVHRHTLGWLTRADGWRAGAQMEVSSVLGELHEQGIGHSRSGHDHP